MAVNSKSEMDLSDLVRPDKMDDRADQESLVTVGVCSAVERLLDRMG